MLALLIFPGWWGVVVAALVTLMFVAVIKRMQSTKHEGSHTITYFSDGTTEKIDNPSRGVRDTGTVIVFLIWLGTMWFIFT